MPAGDFPARNHNIPIPARGGILWNVLIGDNKQIKVCVSVCYPHWMLRVFSSTDNDSIVFQSVLTTDVSYFLANAHTMTGYSGSFFKEPKKPRLRQRVRFPFRHARLPHEPVWIFPAEKPHSCRR